MRQTTRFVLLLLLLVATGAAWAETDSKTTGRFLGAKTTVYPEWFKESFLDLREDIQEAADEGKRVMIFFHQERCPYCNLMVEKNLSQKEISDSMQQHLDVIEFNMWGDREVTGLDGANLTEKEFAAALRVQFTPTILAFDENGNVVLRLNGYIPPQKFKVALDYVINRREQAQSYRQYLASQRPAQPSGTLNPQPFFNTELKDLTRNNHRPLAVFFEQTQCPGCDSAHREVFDAHSVRTEIHPFDTVQLDMWSNQQITTPDGRQLSTRNWAKELGVTFAPTVVLFDGNGQEVIRSEAYFKQFHTASIFNYVSSGDYRKQPSFQRYLSARAEHIRETGQDVNIWQ
ncbi:MAG: thioredoxin fold domain-containing protein [Chromatiales bacterium]|nr:thioredoxin fold domain-containing protein [Chromatiales bacterium]